MKGHIGPLLKPPEFRLESFFLPRSKAKLYRISINNNANLRLPATSEDSRTQKAEPKSQEKDRIKFPTTYPHTQGSRTTLRLRLPVVTPIPNRTHKHQGKGGG